MEVLTNMVFKKRLPDNHPSGRMFEGPVYPPGVTYCNSLLDVMLHTARIINTSQKNIFIVMDEIQNFMSAYEWNSPLGRDFVIYLGIISKLRQTYMLATPDIKMFPRGIRDPDADVATALLYKDIEHTYDFNLKAGTGYKSKEVVFVERPGCKKEVWEIGLCPWAMPEEQVKVGNFVYDHLVPGSRFTLGKIGDYEFDFRDVIAKVEHTIAEAIPGKLIEYVREINAYQKYLNMRSESTVSGTAKSASETAGEIATPDPVRIVGPDGEPIEPDHGTPDDHGEEVQVEDLWPTVESQVEDTELRRKVEKKIIIPWLGAFSTMTASALDDAGFSFSYSYITKTLKQARGLNPANPANPQPAKRGRPRKKAAEVEQDKEAEEGEEKEEETGDNQPSVNDLFDDLNDEPEDADDTEDIEEDATDDEIAEPPKEGPVPPVAPANQKTPGAEPEMDQIDSDNHL